MFNNNNIIYVCPLWIPYVVINRLTKEHNYDVHYIKDALIHIFMLCLYWKSQNCTYYNMWQCSG